MNHDQYDDSYIRGILNTVKTIAMVGASAKDNRPSYFAFKYLGERGYNMIPINPGLAGKELLGRKIYARLSEVPEPIDMVDVFRAANYALPIVQEALTLSPKPRVIWMQLGIRNDEAAALAEANGMKVVMNRCPKIEYGRLSSEIGWIGVNSRTLSSKRAQISARACSACRSTGRAMAAALRHASCARMKRAAEPEPESMNVPRVMLLPNGSFSVGAPLDPPFRSDKPAATFLFSPGA